MRTEQKLEMPGTDVFNLKDEREIKSVDMTQPIQVLFDNFINFLSKTDFE